MRESLHDLQRSYGLASIPLGGHFETYPKQSQIVAWAKEAMAKEQRKMIFTYVPIGVVGFRDRDISDFNPDESEDSISIFYDVSNN